MQTAISSMAATVERLVNRVSELEKSSNQHPKTITIPQVSLTTHPYYMAEPPSKYTLETAMSSQMRFSLDNDSDNRHNHTNVTGRSVIADNQIDAGNGLSIPQSHGLRSDRGYSSESLPHVELVSPMIRRKIIEGKDINLAVLLISHYEGAMTNEERSEYLGIILDSTSLEARLPVNKVQGINNILVSFLDKKSCTKRELLSLLGHLNFASRVIRPGRSFVSHLIFLSTKVKELHHYVKLDTEVRSEIRMWQLFLQEWNGVSFFLDVNITAAADMHLFTDATDKAFGGIFQNKWFQSLFPKDLLILDNHSPSMALLELYPIVIACFLWGKQWNKKRILFHCDNMATVQILNKGRSKNNVISKLMRMLTWITAQCNFTVHAEHVPGKLNDIADAISRFQMKKFRSLAPDTDPHPTPCPQLQELMKF